MLKRFSIALALLATSLAADAANFEVDAALGRAGRGGHGRWVQCFYQNEYGQLYRAFGRRTLKVSQRARQQCYAAGSRSCQLRVCKAW